MLRRLPWVTAIIAAVVIFNPIGMDVIGSAVRQSPTDWLRHFWLWVTIAGAAAILTLGALEYWLRRRRQRRLPISSAQQLGRN